MNLLIKTLYYLRRMTLEIPQMFTDRINQGNAQIKWCFYRCKVCNSIFTVTLLYNDVPVATKCMMEHRYNMHIYSKEELKGIIE